MKSAKIKRKKQHDMYLGYGEISRLLSEREKTIWSVTVTPLPCFKCHVRRMSATVRQQLPQMKFTTSGILSEPHSSVAPLQSFPTYLVFFNLLFQPVSLFRVNRAQQSFFFFGLILFVDQISIWHRFLHVYPFFLYHPPTPTTPTLSECNS